MSNPYSILGVSENASKDEIKKAYKKLAMKYHPDKGGCQKKFQEITNAYDSLMNPKSSFDDIGFNHGFSTHSFGGFNPFGENDMFSKFFGGTGFFNNQQKFVEKTINVSMKDIYKGTTKQINISNEEDCKTCSTICSSCKGKGIKIVNTTRTIGNAQIIQTSQIRCTDCINGVSNNPLHNNCHECKNTKKIKNSKNIKIDIEPGSIDKTEFVYRDVIPNTVLKINLIIDYMKNYSIDNHKKLNYKLRIPFIDTIFGNKYELEHPSGQIIVDTSNINYILTRDKPFIIYNKGLTQNTHLYIFFDIVYPTINKSINQDKKQLIKSYLQQYLNER
jgi:DnaJ family protein A protein 2